MINHSAVNPKSPLKRSLHFNSQLMINDDSNSYKAYEESMLAQIEKLAQRFPKRSVHELKALIEEFDNYEETLKELESKEMAKEHHKMAEEEVVPLETFSLPNIPIQQENKFLKEALIQLYREYLRKIKQNEQHKRKLLQSEQKIRRVQYLHNTIKQIDVGNDEIREPEQHKSPNSPQLHHQSPGLGLIEGGANAQDDQIIYLYQSGVKQQQQFVSIFNQQ